MPRLHAAVATHVQIPTLLGSNDADVLALGLGALTRATRDRKFDFVRRAQALVAILDLNGEPDAVLHAVAAPCGADAGLHGAHRLAIGMSGLEARGNQVRPD